MSFDNDVIDLAIEFGIEIQGNDFISLMSIIEAVCVAKNGYFILKVDGERIDKKYTISINLPYPMDFILRKDTDEIFEGIKFIISELSSLIIKK